MEELKCYSISSRCNSIVSTACFTHELALFTIRILTTVSIKKALKKEIASISVKKDEYLRVLILGEIFSKSYFENSVWMFLRSVPVVTERM